MNPELHHKWNAGRDGTRESGKPPEFDPQAKVPQNKVLLKQSKPR
jgi:hypothetical protein